MVPRRRAGRSGCPLSARRRGRPHGGAARYRAACPGAVRPPEAPPPGPPAARAGYPTGTGSTPQSDRPPPPECPAHRRGARPPAPAGIPTWSAPPSYGMAAVCTKKRGGAGRRRVRPKAERTDRRARRGRRPACTAGGA